MLEPGYGYIRVRQFQDRTGEDLAKALKDMYKQGELKGLVLDLRSDPGGLLNQAVAVSAAFLPKDALVVYTDGRTAGGPDAPHGVEGALHAPRRRLPQGPAGRASRRCRSSCSSTAAPRRRRKSSPARCRTTSARPCSARRRSARARCRRSSRSRNNAGLKLTTARYYTPSGRSIQAKGIEPDIYVDDGRDSPNRIREANLENHLGTGRSESATAKAVETLKQGVTSTPRQAKASTVAAPAAAPRFEFGSADDFQLTQAMNQLKGQPVIASTKAVSAQAKPQ